MENRMLKVVAILAVFPGAAGAQTASERLLWSFKTDDRTTEQFIARAPSGVIYIADNTATYALSPEGDLLWSTPDASGDAFGTRPISLGADGTLYTGVSPAGEPYAPVIALNPDGSTKWRFIPDRPLDLAGGPGVGPDGAIYAVQEGGAAGGLGAFALDAEGNLIWATRRFRRAYRCSPTRRSRSAPTAFMWASSTLVAAATLRTTPSTSTANSSGRHGTCARTPRPSPPWIRRTG